MPTAKNDELIQAYFRMVEQDDYAGGGSILTDDATWPVAPIGYTWTGRRAVEFMALTAGRRRRHDGCCLVFHMRDGRVDDMSTRSVNTSTHPTPPCESSSTLAHAHPQAGIDHCSATPWARAVDLARGGPARAFHGAGDDHRVLETSHGTPGWPATSHPGRCRLVLVAGRETGTPSSAGPENSSSPSGLGGVYATSATNGCVAVEAEERTFGDVVHRAPPRPRWSTSPPRPNSMGMVRPRP